MSFHNFTEPRNVLDPVHQAILNDAILVYRTWPHADFAKAWCEHQDEIRAINRRFK